MTTMIQKYNKKVDNAKQRGIHLDLTFEQFKRLHTLSDVCDYTGVKFDNGNHIKSIERIDDQIGYTISNCCMISMRVNSLKDSYFDKMKGSHKISPEDFKLLLRVKDTLDNKTAEQLTAKYRTNTTEESKMDNKVEQTCLGEARTLHDDLKVAESYINFCKDKGDFDVSFPKFKQLNNKKSCMITGKTFNKDHHYNKQVICKVDQELGWMNDNVQVICQLAYTLINNTDFTKKELDKLAGKL